MNRDLELPAGFQDADFEMRDLEAAGRRESQLRKRGICAHGWSKQLPDGGAQCLHCNAVFPSTEALYAARREALS